MMIDHAFLLWQSQLWWWQLRKVCLYQLLLHVAYSMKCLMLDYTLVQEPFACYTMDSTTQKKKKKESSLTKQALDS